MVKHWQVNRDTMSFATKLSHIVYEDGTARDVMKTPKTDTGKVPSLSDTKRVVHRPNSKQGGQTVD